MVKVRNRGGAAVVAVLVVALIGLVAYLLPRGTTVQSVPQAQPVPWGAATSPVAVTLVVGDGVLATTAPAQASSSYAMTAGRLLGWKTVVDARAGTGYATPTGTGAKTSFASRLAASTATPGTVVLAGGNDDARAGVSSSQETQAAARVVRAVRHRFPKAKIVILGPVPVAGIPEAAAGQVRDALRSVARAADVAFVEPAAPRWYAGATTTMLTADRAHLTPAGHATVGLALADSLSRTAG